MTAGRVVIVTGAASGIGAATVTELARRGARVLAADLREPSLDGVDEVAGEVVPHQADVSDAASVEAMVAAAVERFGALNGIFNNAGWLGPIADVTEYPADAFEHVFAVNVRGVFHGMKYAIPALRAAGGGAIVNTASTGALIAAPALSAYVASKHAVLGLTRSVALEVARDRIAVNALCPGNTDTPMITDVGEADPEAARAAMESRLPTGRWGRPDEMASVAAWLLLEAPEYLTGVPIAVDGGFTAT